jgi:hypothetical protein
MCQKCHKIGEKGLKIHFSPAQRVFGSKLLCSLFGIVKMSGGLLIATKPAGVAQKQVSELCFLGVGTSAPSFCTHFGV